MTRILQIEQIRPLILSVIRHFHPSEVKKTFKTFLSWSICFQIAGGGGGGVLDRHYGLRAKEVADGSVTTTAQLIERMKGIARTDAEFREGFVRARVSKKTLSPVLLASIGITESWCCKSRSWWRLRRHQCLQSRACDPDESES